MITEQSCAVNSGNVSKASCSTALKEPLMFLLAEQGVKLTDTDLLTDTAIQILIAQKKLRPINVVTLIEDTSAGDIVEEVGGREQVVGYGEGRYKYLIDLAQCGYESIKSIEQRISSGFDAFIVDKSNNISGLLNFNGDLEALPLNNFTISAPNLFGKQAETTKTTATFRIDLEEISQQIFRTVETFIRWKYIDGLVDVDLINVSNDGATVTTDVVSSCGVVAITGLDPTDFADISGVQSVSLVESPLGTYAVTYSSAITPGEQSIELKVPELQISKLYETKTAGSFVAVAG